MKKILFSLIVCVFCLSSCSPLKEVQYTGVKGFNVQKINTTGIEGDVILGVKNPNTFGFAIYPSEFDVTYSGVYLGKAKLMKRVFIKRNTEENYNFHLSSDFKDVNLMDVVKLLSGATFKNQIEIKGELKAGKWWMKKKYPVDLKERIKLN